MKRLLVLLLLMPALLEAQVLQWKYTSITETENKGKVLVTVRPQGQKYYRDSLVTKQWKDSGEIEVDLDHARISFDGETYFLDWVGRQLKPGYGDSHTNVFTSWSFTFADDPARGPHPKTYKATLWDRYSPPYMEVQCEGSAFNYIYYIKK